MNSQPPAGGPSQPVAAQASRDLALAEYKLLKGEQAARIGQRDGLRYGALIAIAGTLAIAHTAGNHACLLLIPPLTFILGWTHLVNDQIITAIGRYVREHPALPGAGWEHNHLADRHRASRKAIQLGTDIVTFCGSAVVALVAVWLVPESPLLLAVSAVEAVATGLLAQQFALYSGTQGT